MANNLHTFIVWWCGKVQPLKVDQPPCVVSAGSIVPVEYMQLQAAMQITDIEYMVCHSSFATFLNVMVCNKQHPIHCLGETA